jgi:hypothetical protein
MAALLNKGRTGYEAPWEYVEGNDYPTLKAVIRANDTDVVDEATAQIIGGIIASTTFTASGETIVYPVADAVIAADAGELPDALKAGGGAVSQNDFVPGTDGRVTVNPKKIEELIAWDTALSGLAGGTSGIISLPVIETTVNPGETALFSYSLNLSRFAGAKAGDLVIMKLAPAGLRLPRKAKDFSDLADERYIITDADGKIIDDGEAIDGAADYILTAGVRDDGNYDWDKKDGHIIDPFAVGAANGGSSNPGGDGGSGGGSGGGTTTPPSDDDDADDSGTTTVTLPGGGEVIISGGEPTRDPVTGVVTINESGEITLSDNISLVVPPGTTIDPATGVINVADGGSLTLPNSAAFTVPPATTIDSTTGELTATEGGWVTLPGGREFDVPPGTTINPSTGTMTTTELGVLVIPDVQKEDGTKGYIEFVLPAGSTINPTTGGVTLPGGTVILPGLNGVIDTIVSSASRAAGENDDISFTIPQGASIDPNTGETRITAAGTITGPDGPIEVKAGAIINPFTGEVTYRDAGGSQTEDSQTASGGGCDAGFFGAGAFALLAAGTLLRKRRS